MTNESELIQKIDFNKKYDGKTFNELATAFQMAILINKMHEVIDEVNKLSMKIAVSKTKKKQKSDTKYYKLNSPEKLKNAFL